MYGTFHLLTTFEAVELVLEAFFFPFALLLPALVLQRKRNPLRPAWYSLALLAAVPSLWQVLTATLQHGGRPPYDAIYVPSLISGHAAQMSFAASAYIVIALLPTFIAPASAFRPARRQLVAALILGFVASLALVPLRVPLTQPLSVLLRSLPPGASERA